MKPKQPTRSRPVVAVTLSPMALQKLELLKRHYGKTALSHVVEKIIEDTFEKVFEGNIVGNGTGGFAALPTPETIKPRQAGPVIKK